MSFCETCGKRISALNTYKTNGITQCYECAAKTAEEKLRSGGNAFDVGYKVNEANNNNTVQVAKIKDTLYAGRVSSPWIRYLKTIALINIIVGIIASFAVGVFVYNVIYGDEAFIFAAITVIVGIMLSALFTALLMVFAEMAEDISIMRYLMNKE